MFAVNSEKAHYDCNMLIIPAIDLSEGQVVRLRQGDMRQKTVYSDDPVAQARMWETQGAEVIHIVDLDGAVSGQAANLEAVEKIVENVPIPVEMGGGLRTADDVAQVLDLGVRWAIMGTAALRNRSQLEEALRRFGEQIIVGIDARDGRVAVQGWTEGSEVEAIQLAQEMEQLGVQRLICTDIATDGMLRGPNIGAMRNLAEAVQIPIIASGGVSSVKDIRALRELEPLGVIGCIIGRALYDGRLSLAEAIGAASE